MHETRTEEIRQKTTREREREYTVSIFVLISDTWWKQLANSTRPAKCKRLSVLHIEVAREYITGFCRIILQLTLKDEQHSGLLYVLLSVLLLMESTYAR